MSTRLLNTDQAASLLRVSYWTLVHWRRPGGKGPTLPTVRVGRKLFYHPDDVNKILDERRPIVVRSKPIPTKPANPRNRSVRRPGGVGCGDPSSIQMARAA